MAATYDEAVAELFRGPHATFVAERKRLASELKAAGDKAGAATFARLGRPPISAWAVNQLWWQARAEFDVFLETAKRMKEGDLGATPAHRASMQALRARAAQLLTEAGNAANEGTLRRVATTLSAIAAHGGFAPDVPGALSDDRDPPGFEAAGIPAIVPVPALKAAPVAAEEAGASAEELWAAQEAALRETQRVEAEFKRARGEVERICDVISSLQRQVMDAERQLVQARARVSELENN